MDFEIINSNCPMHCRTCLNKFQDIKHKVKELSTPILLLLKQCAEYEEVVHSELYPDGICEACYEKLEDFNEFQIVCKKSKQFLDKLLNAGSAICHSDFESIDKEYNKMEEIDEVSEPYNTIIDPQEIENIVHEEIVKVGIEDFVNLHGNTDVDNELLNSSATSEDHITEIEEIINAASKTHICSVCQKILSSSTALKRHLLNHADARPFSCDVCDRGFNAKCQLMRHMEEHSVIEIVCKFNCGETFDRTYKAEKHYRKHHKHDIIAKRSKPDVSSYVCEECGKSFKSRRSLKDHRNSHLPEEQRPYKCEQCNKRFSTASDLRIHVMRHNKTQNYQCSHCGLRKTTARELRLHISNIHTKDRQVRCDICSKMFLNPGCLKRHKEVVHFGYKKFKCSYCDESFGAADTLKYHERRHTGSKPNQCNTCGHSFIQPYALKKHMNTHKSTNETL